MSDKKHKRYPTILLDPAKLQLDLKVEDSIIIIRDQISKEIVGVVIRNFGKEEELIVYRSTQYTK